MKYKKARSIIFLFSLFILNSEEITKKSSSYARFNFVEGKTYIQRAFELGFEEAKVDMPLTRGDRLETEEGRAELYLFKGNYLRLDFQTKIDIIDLTREKKDHTQIQIWRGNVYLSLDYLDREKSFEINTPDLSIYLLEKGLYRVDVKESGETEITVYQGLVEASGKKGATLLKNEQRLESKNGLFIHKSDYFYPAPEDDFERWSEKRESEIRKQVARKGAIRKSPSPEKSYSFKKSNSVFGHILNYITGSKKQEERNLSLPPPPKISARTKKTQVGMAPRGLSKSRIKKERKK